MKKTTVEEGWRIPVKEKANTATTVEEGWRAPAKGKGRRATKVETSWRTAAQILSPENSKNGEQVNAFARIEDFKAAMETMDELVSNAGVHYKVQGALSKKGGEAAILLCTDPDGAKAVAKVYYDPVNEAKSNVHTRAKVLEYMETEEGQAYTLAVLDFGIIELRGSRYYFEMTPYCPEGDLSKEPPMDFDSIVDITRYLNKALHSIHSFGILHRDIKPENLYKLDGRVVIGDFGVAKLAASGATQTVAGTDGYRAPETVLGVAAEKSVFYLDEKSDYYALGVTLASLFEGKFVYKNTESAAISLAVRNERLPVKRQDPHKEELMNLVRGLIRFDSRERFGYKEVQQWLANHDFTGTSGENGDKWPRPYRLNGAAYKDEQSLFEGLTSDPKNWSEGLDQLYSSTLEAFFKTFRPDISTAARKAVEEYRDKDRDKGLSVFLKSLYPLGPIVWRGYTFGSLQELADKMVVARRPEAYAEFLRKGVISHWLDHTSGIRVDANTRNIVVQIEAYSEIEPETACFWFGNSFAAKRHLSIGKKKVHTMRELIRAMFADPKAFYLSDVQEKLLETKDGQKANKFGADLYGFLYSYGYKEVVDKAWNKAKGCDGFIRACFLISMMDVIAQDAGADAGIIRSFFREYGPIGMYLYVKKLADKREAPVYIALDKEGEQALNAIRGYNAVNTDTVEEIYKAYMPLVDEIEKMHRILMDNPQCIVAGVYEKQGVLCTNLSGCMALELFGRRTPLGFMTYIESAQGGAR